VSELKVEDHTIEVSRPDKVLFPTDGITKADLVEYYRQIGSVMIAHLRNRPVMMQRFPDGIDREGFIQQQIPDYFPDWIQRVTVPKEQGAITHAVCNDVASLVYIANQACITLHTWLSRVDRIECPDQMIFDLDPPHHDLDLPHDVFPQVRSSALALRDLLDELGLVGFVKTTGLFGAHVVVPLDRSANFDEVRAFAREVADELVRRDPQHRTTEMRKGKRGGRLLIDVMRNAYGQTAVAPYSVRAFPGAPVAMPLTWRDLEREDIGPRTFTIRSADEYLHMNGDPWRGIGRRAHSIRRRASASHGDSASRSSQLRSWTPRSS
jgi:bifunctional non-homologous end joining protein LigD